MLDCDDRFPTQSSRVPDRMHLRRRGAVEHGVEPIVPLEPDGGLVLVARQGNLAYGGPALDIDEPDGDTGLREMALSWASSFRKASGSLQL